MLNCRIKDKVLFDVSNLTNSGSLSFTNKFTIFVTRDTTPEL